MIAKLISYLKKSIIYFILISLLLVVAYRYAPVPITMSMIGTYFENKELNYKWVGKNNISPNAYLAVIAAEDQRFFDHHGFDFESIQKAYKNNKEGKTMRGGSTLSQQVAKNVFLWQGRSYLRKGLEAYFTILIELLWSKERILEVYTNVAQTGPSTYGFEKASQQYFNKKAIDINTHESARIAAILPNPKKWKAQPAGPYVAKRTRFLVRQMNQLGGVKYLKERN